LACVQGRWTEAADFFRRAEEAWEKEGDRFTASMATANRGEILSDQGRLDEAEPLFRGPLRVARASYSTFLIGGFASIYGRLAARAGRFEEAHELFAEARRASDEVGARDELVFTDARLAECFVLEGLPERARDLAVGTLGVARSQPGVSQLVPMLERVRGAALVQLGELDEAEEALEESMRAARERKADYELALALDALVTLRALRDEPSEVLEAERDEIFERLDVVSVPAVPLPERARVRG
jgi:tetratricopeptide (TPR) repeat protein